MRAMTWVAAALVLAFATACDDRDRNQTADRVDNAADEAGAALREGADDGGDAARDAADDAEDAVDGLDDYSFDRRDEFRRNVNERLANLDRELAEAERGLNEDAAEGRAEAVAAARDARRAVDRSVDRIGSATRDGWDSLRDEIGDALSAAELRVRELRSDAKPMGGTGGPS